MPCQIQLFVCFYKPGGKKSVNIDFLDHFTCFDISIFWSSWLYFLLDFHQFVGKIVCLTRTMTQIVLKLTWWCRTVRGPIIDINRVRTIECFIAMRKRGQGRGASVTHYAVVENRSCLKRRCQGSRRQLSVIVFIIGG